MPQINLLLLFNACPIGNHVVGSSGIYPPTIGNHAQNIALGTHSLLQLRTPIDVVTNKYMFPSITIYSK
jgi:hypothetical protein